MNAARQRHKLGTIFKIAGEQNHSTHQWVLQSRFLA
jgi:hypothetical protein